MDDGNGSAKVKILSHKHEVMTGKTYSLTFSVIGLDENNETVSEQNLNKYLSKNDQCHKLISFIDLGNI